MLLCCVNLDEHGTSTWPPESFSSVAHAESSATSGYVAVPEHFGQNEEPAGSNEEQTRKKHNFVPKVDLFDAKLFPRM